MFEIEEDRFEIASRVKPRFNHTGLISVEDLWDVPLEAIDGIFKQLNKEAKELKEESLLTKKNFYAEKLGRTYDVRILTNTERVTSIALDRKAKVFMRSEKPRKLGGSITVTFRSPSPKLGKKEKKVKI